LVGNLDRIVSAQGARIAARRARIALAGLSTILTVLSSMALSLGARPIEATLAVIAVLPTIAA
jgi:hypothetical protein